MTKRFVALALMLLVVLSLVACSSDTIVGKWKYDVQGVGSTVTEFTQDGKVIIEVAVSQPSASAYQKLEGTYTIKDDQLTTESNNKKRTYTYVIEGNQLKLTDKDGKATSYTRQ